MHRLQTHCIAYGSNLHPYRISERISSARPVGVVSLPGMRLTFHKRSNDGSGKGMFVQTGSDTDELSCVIYELELSGKSELDRIEGFGYKEQLMSVVADGIAYRPSIYVAASTHINPMLVPYHWYKEMVILGANYHRMPDSYIDSIRATTSTEDRDPKRAAANERILIAMRNINRSNGCAID